MYSVSMHPTNVQIHKIQFCFTKSATLFANSSCFIWKQTLQFCCILRWRCRRARFGVQTGPEISLKMSHFKERLYQVFSVRINPLCVCLQSRTELYCWKPLIFLYLKKARSSIIIWICNATSTNAYILLTVHLDITSGKWPTWCTILLYNTFISILYMFRANTCSSSGGQLQFLLDLRTGRTLTESDYTRCCINTVDLLMISTCLLETCRGLK